MLVHILVSCEPSTTTFLFPFLMLFFPPLIPSFIFNLTGDLKRLRSLVVDAKEKGIKVVSALVKKMLDRNVFLFGSVDTNDASVTERVNELTDIQNARIQVAYKKYSSVYNFFPFKQTSYTAFSSSLFLLLI